MLLHGPGAYGASWQQVVPSLVTTHRVVAPDLPGHGSSSPLEQGSDADAVVDWLGELIDRTCSAPPVLVGQLVGGAIAARLAADRGDRLERLVLVVPFGLEPFLPTPTFGTALTGYLTAPSETSHDELWDQCVYDLEALRRRPSVRWEPMKAYNVELAASGDSVRSLQLLMELFGFPALPEEMLGRIAVPTTLIWGRRDSIVPLAVGERASTRFGWPLRVIESVGNEPAVEAPDAFVQALLDDTTTGEETAR